MSVRIWQPTARLQKDSFLINVLSEGRQCISATGGVTKYIMLCVWVCGACVWMCVYACVCVCVSVFLIACMCLYVTDQKRAKIQKIINWVLFVLPLHMMSYTTESERSLVWPRVHEPRKNDTSNWASRVERVSCHIGRRGGWCLLTFQNGQTHPPRLAVCVASHFQALPPTLLFFSVTPRFSLNIFTFPDSENTVNSPCDSERAWEWGKCVHCMCDVVLSSRLRQPYCTCQPMWTGTQKKE